MESQFHAETPPNTPWPRSGVGNIFTQFRAFLTREAKNLFKRWLNTRRHRFSFLQNPICCALRWHMRTRMCFGVLQRKISCSYWSQSEEENFMFYNFHYYIGSYLYRSKYIIAHSILISLHRPQLHLDIKEQNKQQLYFLCMS